MDILSTDKQEFKIIHFPCYKATWYKDAIGEDKTDIQQ